MKLAFAVALLLPIAAFATPPPGADPNSPEAKWYQGANNPSCWSCCSQADGRPVQARATQLDSPLGWDVLLDGVWTPIPAGTRATQCKAAEATADDRHGGASTPIGDYPPHPAGSAVVWIFPAGTIRCFSPPASGG